MCRIIRIRIRNSNSNAQTNATQNPPPSHSNATATATAQQHLQNTFRFTRGFADDAGRAIGNLLPKASLQNLTARKYTLPDKTVASQVLMYRQLLHTKCRPGLKLSRPFQETPAQKAVMHMPWWEQGIEETKKMTISYDNLITRLWRHGAIEPYENQGTNDLEVDDLLSFDTPAAGLVEQDTTPDETETGLPPVPHPFWVDRLGFQQPDPVTDFRSGGVLSLAMMVYMVESRPRICQRFFTGDTKVLPFGITCINVTDMIAKFLMLAKSTDRMDALLSQKPFWKMFADPNAITAVQELSLSMLCDVAVELGAEKKIPSLAEESNTSADILGNDEITVFDFSTIMERTERRVRDDLLGAGPKTVEELRSIEGRLRVKYKHQLDRKIQRAREKQDPNYDVTTATTAAAVTAAASGTSATATTPTALDTGISKIGAGLSAASPQLKDAMGKASNFAGGFFGKVKDRLHTPKAASANASAESATIVELPPMGTEPPVEITASPLPATAAATATTTTPIQAPASSNSLASSDGDWVEAGTDLAAATDGIMNFSIGDDDDSL